MRILFVAAAIVLFLILSLPVYFILRLIGKKQPRMMAAASQKIVAATFRFVLFLAGTKITVIGREHVPKKAVLYTANHRGFADIPVAYITAPTLMGFMAKKEMLRLPVFSWWMKNMNCIFLDRSDMKEGMKSILLGIQHIKDGYSVFIMPEGTRNQQEEPLPFKEGSLKMAEKTGCPIIPVAISNTDAVFERQQPFVKRAHVIIHYGTPIYPDTIPKENKKFLGAHVRDIIINMLNEDKDLFKS